MHSPTNIPEPVETEERRFQERIDRLRGELEEEFRATLRILEQERLEGIRRIDEMTARTLEAVEAEREQIEVSVAEEEKRLRSLAAGRMEEILREVDPGCLAENLVDTVWGQLTGGVFE